MCDEEWKQHLFTARALLEAEALLEVVADHNMVMVLLKDIPTLEAKPTKNWMCPDNVFCSSNLTGTVVSCTTNPRLRGPRANHILILTILEIHVKQTATATSYNF